MTSYLLAYWPWLLVLLLALFGLWGERLRARRLLQWFSPAALAHQQIEPGRRRLPFALGLAGIFALAMALQHWSPRPAGTVWLLVDASRSMGVVEADGRTRWQQAAHILSTWTRTTPQPVAIVAFQRQAWLVVPPTHDRDTLVQNLSDWQPRTDAQGSDPQAALALFARLGSADDIGLLVSDGEWEASLPPSTLPVVALIAGDPTGGPVPRIAGDPPGPLHSVPNPTRLAALTAGRILAAASGSPDAIDALLASDHLDARRWALLGLALLSLEMLSILRNRYRLTRLSLPYTWIQRYANWRLQGTVGLALLMLLTGAAPTWESHWRQRQSPARATYDGGVHAMAAGDRKAAEAAWREAIRLDPAWQPAWYNLGTLLATIPQERASALTALERAVSLAPDDPWAQGNLHALRVQVRADAVSHSEQEPVIKFLGATDDGWTKGPASIGSDGEDQSTGSAPAGSGGKGQSTKPAGTGSDDEDQGTKPASARNNGNHDPNGIWAGNGERPSTSSDPESTKPLTAAQLDHLLDAAEGLTDAELGRLKAQADRNGSSAGEIPALSAEQIRRVLDLAARVPSGLPQPVHDDANERPDGPATLRW